MRYLTLDFFGNYCNILLTVALAAFWPLDNLDNLFHRGRKGRSIHYRLRMSSAVYFLWLSYKYIVYTIQCVMSCVRYHILHDFYTLCCYGYQIQILQNYLTTPRQTFWRGGGLRKMNTRCGKVRRRDSSLPSMSLNQWESGWNLIGWKTCPQVGNAGCLWCLLATCLTPISIFISRGAVREKYGIDGDSVKDQTNEGTIRDGEGKVTSSLYIGP
jgi:hypothetical protein